MREDVQQRALEAINRMMRDGIGIMRASRLSRTTRRTVRNYMRLKGIRSKMVRGNLKIVPSMEQRINSFIMHMNNGYSATASAKAVGTTVRTMARKEINGNPIIIRGDRFWELNVVPLYRQSIVVYGRITGLGDNIQGSGAVPPELDENRPDNQSNLQEDDIKSPEADTAIWFQVDFDDFITTLDRQRVGAFYRPLIMEALREQLETPNIPDESLALRFLNNEDVRQHSTENNRLQDGEITRLEQIMNRYNVRLHTPANYGVDDNLIPRDVEFISLDELGQEVSFGDFNVFMLRGDEPSIYPQEENGRPYPVEIRLDYNLQDELEDN